LKVHLIIQTLDLSSLFSVSLHLQSVFLLKQVCELCFFIKVSIHQGCWWVEARGDWVWTSTWNWVLQQKVGFWI